jgi:hypothetical protein
MSGHVFDNLIALDLSGLRFHAGAKAKYPSTDVLTVHSGHVTDTLTLHAPHGTQFAVANDGHGGTKITLDPPATITHAVALLAGNDLSAGEWAGDLTAGGNHMSDFLLTA